MLLALWFPRTFYPLRYRVTKQIQDADFVLVQSGSDGTFEFCPVEPICVTPLCEQATLFGRYYSKQTAVKAAIAQQQEIKQIVLDETNKMIVYRHTRFVYSQDTKRFERLFYISSMANDQLVVLASSGLTSSSARAAHTQYGSNALSIVVPSIPILLMREVFHPFFIFQLYSVILWYFEAYYYFAACIFVLATISIVTTLIETRSRLTALSELAKHESRVRVLRDRQWQEISSLEMVPGDIVELTQTESNPQAEDVSNARRKGFDRRESKMNASPSPGIIVPCDIALLSGSCVVNESMLTGESIPVLKGAVTLPSNTQSTQPISLGFDQRNTLFAATKILQLKPTSAAGGLIGGKVTGIVVRAGFATSKGSLILSILYPKPSTFKFFEQSMKFVFSMFCLALIGFIVSEVKLKSLDYDLATLIIRGLDLITM